MKVISSHCVQDLTPVNPEQPQVALITLGKEGALLVTEKEVKHIRPMEVEKPQSFVGNGTAATLGFMVGYIKGLPHEKSADLAMAMAAEKIQQRSPYAHIVAPEKALKRALLRPELRDVAHLVRSDIPAQASYRE